MRLLNPSTKAAPSPPSFRQRSAWTCSESRPVSTSLPTTIAWTRAADSVRRRMDVPPTIVERRTPKGFISATPRSTAFAIPRAPRLSSHGIRSGVTYLARPTCNVESPALAALRSLMLLKSKVISKRSLASSARRTTTPRGASSHPIEQWAWLRICAEALDLASVPGPSIGSCHLR